MSRYMSSYEAYQPVFHVQRDAINIITNLWIIYWKDIIYRVECTVSVNLELQHLFLLTSRCSFKVLVLIEKCRRYARCWWHLTLHIINVEKNVRVFFFIFFFLICVCIPWAWLGWRWCGCVLMYCSLFRNFTFCFYSFLFYFGLLVYICVVGVFL